MALQVWLPRPKTHWDPFGEMVDLQHELNRLFKVVSGKIDRSETLPETPWTPIGDIYETKDQMVVVLELPGVNQKEIDISVVDDILSIRGERHREEHAGETSYHRVERSYGPFSRTLALPSIVDADRIKAAYRDGLLEIRLPKREEAKPKAIPIEDA